MVRMLRRRGFHVERAVLRVRWWSLWWHARAAAFTFADRDARAGACADAAAFIFADRDARNVGADAV